MSFDPTEPLQCPPKAGTRSFAFLLGLTNEIFVDSYQNVNGHEKIQEYGQVKCMSMATLDAYGMVRTPWAGLGSS